MKRPNLKLLKRTEVLQLAKYLGVKFPSGINKDEIIELLCSSLEQEVSKSESEGKEIEIKKVEFRTGNI